MRKVTSAEELCEAVTTMNHGDTVIYHTGQLVADGLNSLKLMRLAEMARSLSNMSLITLDGSVRLGMGLVTLTQRRLGPGVFEYRATRVPKGRGNHERG